MLTEEEIRNEIAEHTAILNELGNDTTTAHLIEWAIIQAYKQVLEEE